MSKTLSSHCPRLRRARVAGLLVLAAGMCGCASFSQDVDAYYRQMAYNYREAQEKAKLEEVQLERMSTALAATGQTGKSRRAHRELERVKSWEEKCEKQAMRFQKAAEWTESRFHLNRPAIPDGPPTAEPHEDQAVLQASGAKDP
jgi:hypothetical protein